MEDSERVIGSRGMEDSVAVNIAVAKGLLWCAIKGNKVSAVYINWHVHTLPLPIREYQKERNLKENFLVAELGFICLIDLKWKGKFTF